METWASDEDNLAYFGWMCVRGEGKAHGLSGVATECLETSLWQRAACSVKQPGFSATVVFVLCVLAFIC